MGRFLGVVYLGKKLLMVSVNLCSKYVPEFLFGKLRMRYCVDEPYFPEKENQFHVK